MDCLALHGGSPANFCDIGGGATTEAVKKAFDLLIQDPNVKSIFVNVRFAASFFQTRQRTDAERVCEQIFGGM